MARNLLVINVALRETRVALIEDGVIAELQIERARARSTVGNIVLGKVTRVLPGMQAAFIDVGMERAAFLHVEDLIRPDDFEDYLAGAAHALERKTDLDNEKGEDGDEKPAAPSQEAPRQPPPLSASRPLELAHDDDPDSDDDDDDGEEVSHASHAALDDDDVIRAHGDADDDEDDDAED